ncbi:hypothetical protein AB833_31120 [Chromatiales bacterium (ex Bugula neritina AB1)]|nr:hypothetical protein AB833_31120 [Chromatiales bacterium (ex Bugula neritina AB1)]
MLESILNLQKYPIDNLASEAATSLVAAVRSQLDTEGSCTLKNFVQADALQQMATEAASLIDLAYAGPAQVSPYFFNYAIADTLDVDDNHPVHRKGKRNLSQVAADLIPSGHLLSQLYHSNYMTDFLAEVLQQPVYRNQDKYQSLNISVMNSGGCQQWHFDGGNMVTTLLLQAPLAGGVFEYAQNIRSDSDENFEAVRKVLDGESDRVKALELEAGTLSLFRGHYSLHRVTEVQGKRQRLQAILGYSTRPDLTGSLKSSALHYGERVLADNESTSGHY